MLRQGTMPATNPERQRLQEWAVRGDPRSQECSRWPDDQPACNQWDPLILDQLAEGTTPRTPVQHMRKTPAPPSLPIFGYFVLKGEEQGQESWRKHSGLTVSDDALPNGAHDYLNQ